MRREFLKTLGAGAATFLMAQQLRAATPTGPGRPDMRPRGEAGRERTFPP